MKPRPARPSSCGGRQRNKAKRNQEALKKKNRRAHSTWLRPAIKVRLRARLQLLAKRKSRRAMKGRTKKKQPPAMAKARRKGSRAGEAQLLMVSFIFVRKTAPIKPRTSSVNRPAT